MPEALLDALARWGRRCCAAAKRRCGARLERAGPGAADQRVAAGLEALAAPQPALQAMSDAALGFARARFDPERAASALLACGERAGDAVGGACGVELRGGPDVGPGTHVLVISDEALNLVDIRVHLPFAALHRRGADRRVHGAAARRVRVQHGEVGPSCGSTRSGCIAA